MKGTFFQKSLEFRLVIDGESWRQGERVKGTLQVRNHGSEAVALSEVRVLLAEGVDRKVKAKAEDAFDVLATQSPGSAGGSVAPGAMSEALSWEFQLETNARITDKTGSLYALYGRGETSSALGQLQLIVLPRLHFDDFVEVLQNTFRFVTKAKAAGKKNEVEVKMAPPSGKEHTSIEQLLLTMRMDGDNLEATFDFSVKEVDAMSAGLSLKKGKKVFERVFAPAEYLHSFNQRLNKDAVEKAVAEVFKQQKSGPLLG